MALVIIRMRTITHRLIVGSSVAVSALLLAGSPSPIAADESSFETPPVLEASALAPPELLKGTLFQVEPAVPIQHLLGRFTIHSDYGDFVALGRLMLKVRVHEVTALDQLNKTSQTDVFLKAAGNAALRPVTAAENMLLHPEDTVKGLPGGVSRFFDRVKLGFDRIEGAATDSGTSDTEKVEHVTQRVGSVSAEAFGYGQERRALAKKLRVDPYTTNPVLSQKLSDVAWVAFSGRLGVETLVSVFVPGSLALSATSVTNDLVWDTPEADLINLNRTKLGAMGVEAEGAGALMQNKWFSLTVLTYFVTGLDRLGGVSGRGDVIALAASVSSPGQALFITEAVSMLAGYHEQVSPLTHVAAQGTVFGRDRRGVIVVPAPVDYVAWTQGVNDFVRRPDLEAKERRIWLTGLMSPRAKKELAALGWTVREAVPPALQP